MRYKICIEKRKTLRSQFTKLIIAIGIPFIIMIVIILYFLYSFNLEYRATLVNATTASEFNFNFKEKLDLDMYYFVIGSSNMKQLPLDEVVNAKNVIQRLQETTTNAENQWRVDSLLRLCDKLSDAMVKIEQMENYDSRMKMLDQDIYVLTQLVQTYVQEYIYYEVKELSSLQDDIQWKVKVTIGMTALASVLIIVIVLWYSIALSTKITRPIKHLCQKVEHLGEGDFTIVPVETNNVEINSLDEGFNKMIGQINGLLQRVKDNQNALRKAEFELLQAQINPHFLYNTLDSIIWLAEAHQDKEVIQMTSSLSTFFRTSLSNGKDIITIENEMKQIESYLKIQKIRYSDILKYTIHIPNELYEYFIPKLTLQPLVENALYHGVKNKRGVGHIQVLGIEEEDDILLKIMDDGAGMTKEQVEKLQSENSYDIHTGLGIENVQHRLHLYCGPNYGLEFYSEIGIGTTVTVRIPKKMD